MDTGDIDQEVRRFIAEGDLVAVFPFVGRRKGKKAARELHAFLATAIEEAAPETLAALYLQKRARRDRLFAPMATRLRDRMTRDEMSAIIRRLIADDAGGEDELRAILARTGQMDVDELRSSVLSSDYYRLKRAAIFALVKRDDGAWLEERVVAESITGADLGSLFSAAEGDSSMANRLVRLARDGDDSEVLALVCKCFDVDRPIVEKAVASKDPEARRYAMRHAHRLRDARAALAEALTDPDTTVRRAALAFLVQRPDPALRDYVEALVDDPDPYDERYNTEPVSTLARRILQARD